MRKLSVILLLACLVGATACHSNKTEHKQIINRSFYNNVWERFDYVTNTVNIEEETTYNLTMDIRFTDDYAYDYFSMVFTVFDTYGNPYRSKAYQFKLKDADGNWVAEKKDDGHTYNLPINQALQITEPGAYKFMIENRMPITPLVGVKQLTLVNNN